MSSFYGFVSHVVETPSTCVPAKASMISITNAHHSLLTILQFALLPRCLLLRTIVHCDTSVARDVSFAEHCFWSKRRWRPSDFRQNDYHEITWLKWELLTQATQIGPTLFVDADVLILRNPFPYLPSDLSMYYQREDRDGRSLNGGVIWLRNHSLARHIFLQKPQRFRTRSPLDQLIVLDVLPRIDSAALPVEFAGHCWSRGNLSNATVTYHANCVYSASKKALVMQSVLHRTFERTIT